MDARDLRALNTDAGHQTFLVEDDGVDVVLQGRGGEGACDALVDDHDARSDPDLPTIQVNGVERPYLDQIVWAGLVTMALLPATVAPIGRTPAGLPVGLQIVGPYLEDRTTIDFARRLDA